MDITKFTELKQRVIDAGFSDEITWAENIKCRHSSDFFAEFVWVVVSSGMKNQIAEKIYKRVMAALVDRVPINTVFRHEGKVKAINHVLANLKELYFEYLMADDKLTWLEGLPYIGSITKYHLAKNLGLDIAKPDRHLVRISNEYNTTVQELCLKLAQETKSKVAVIDQVIWRAANLGFI